MFGLPPRHKPPWPDTIPYKTLDTAQSRMISRHIPYRKRLKDHPPIPFGQQPLIAEVQHPVIPRWHAEYHGAGDGELLPNKSADLIIGKMLKKSLRENRIE